ncbi:MAG: hypothetical protein AAFR59_03705, partial [Bacteroidota bacterium]
MRLILSTLFLLVTFSLSAQTELAKFPLPNREFQVLPINTALGEEGELMLLMDTRSDFHFAYLDSNINLLKRFSIPKTAGALWDITISGVVNYTDELLIYCYANDFREGDYIVSIDKMARKTALQRIDVELPRKVWLIKAFTYGEQFVKLYVDFKKEALRLLVFERERLVLNQSYPIPYPKIIDQLKRNAGTGIPRIVEDRINSIAIGAQKQKLYTLDGEIILSVEDGEAGATRFFTFQTDTWEMKEETYHYPSFSSSQEVMQINSMIFEGILYQGLVNEEGLSLYQ